MSSSIIQKGPSWPGFNNIKHLVIFGASYCQTVGMYAKGHRIPPPTPEKPLGVPFPGDTYADEAEPNWVGHLIQPQISPASDPQSPSQSPSPSQSKVAVLKLVFNYALGGADVSGVGKQIGIFSSDVDNKKERPEWAALKKDDTLFITWVGINDVAGAMMNLPELEKRNPEPLDFTKSVNELFEYQDEVYKAGGRNFVFVNHPPTHRRYESGTSRDPKVMKYISSIQGWNTTLEQHAREWAFKHSDCTMIIYSSWDTFNRVLDNLDSYQMRGKIWVDHLHPTSAMHKIVAEDLEKLLMSQPAQARFEE